MSFNFSGNWKNLRRNPKQNQKKKLTQTVILQMQTEKGRIEEQIRSKETLRVLIRNITKIEKEKELQTKNIQRIDMEKKLRFNIFLKVV